MRWLAISSAGPSRLSLWPGLATRGCIPFVSFVCVVGTMSGATSASAAFPGANGAVAYVQSSSPYLADPGIHIATPTGSGDRLLTAGTSPSWSPDGRSLAFTLGASVYRIAADGTGMTIVVNDAGWNASPTWAPDGGRIAYVRGVNENAEIWTANADGTGHSQLTRVAGHLLNIRQLAWSPDSRWILFNAWENLTAGDGRLFVVSADGRDVRSLTPTDAVSDYGGDWSPDGGRIAFYRSEPAGGTLAWSVQTMNADGTDTRFVAAVGNFPCPCTVPEFDPSWSPDGKEIVFASDRDGTRDLYVVHRDASTLRRLGPASPTYEYSADWQPVGDLRVALAAKPMRVRARGRVAFSITVRNVGPLPTRSARVAGAVSGGTVVSVASDGATCTKAARFTCDLGELAPNTVKRVVVVLRAGSKRAVRLRAEASAARAEATPADNVGSLTVRVTKH
jgi:dipeptidyl aminopeptidase/acylaminoacyl peptidase